MDYTRNVNLKTSNRTHWPLYHVLKIWLPYGNKGANWHKVKIKSFANTGE